MLSFEALSCDPLRLIKQKFAKSRVFIPRVIETLEGVFSRGGYVSGGSAAIVGRWLFSELSYGTLPEEGPRFKNDDPQNRVEEYLILPSFRIPKDAEDRLKNRFWKSGAGDIDFYFKNDSDASDVIQFLNMEVKRYKVSNLYPSGDAPTLAGWGREYYFGNALVQAITKITGDPCQILESFDIVNAQCYLDKSGFYYTNRWLDCEKRGELEIFRGDKDNLLWRVSKWAVRHNLRVTSDSQKILSHAAVNLAEKIQLGDGPVMWNRPVDMKHLRGKVKELIWRWDASNILLASLILDSYDQLDLLGLISEKSKENDA